MLVGQHHHQIFEKVMIGLDALGDVWHFGICKDQEFNLINTILLSLQELKTSPKGPGGARADSIFFNLLYILIF